MLGKYNDKTMTIKCQLSDRRTRIMTVRSREQPTGIRPCVFISNLAASYLHF